MTDLFIPSAGVQPNVLINGSFDFWQRGTAYVAKSVPQYTADRWHGLFAGPVTTTIRREADISDADILNGTKYYLMMIHHTGAADWGILQRIEDVHQFSGKTIAVSGLVKATNAFDFQAVCKQHFGAGGSADVVTVSDIKAIPAGDDWLEFSFTINVPSIAAKTVGDNSYLEIQFVQKTNQTNTLNLTNLKVEAGSTPTAYMRPNLAEELVKCQRYYRKSYPVDIQPRTVTEKGLQAFAALGAAKPKYYLGLISWPDMRAIPAVAAISKGAAINMASSRYYSSTVYIDLSVTISEISEKGFYVEAFGGGTFSLPSIAALHYTADAEL